MLKRIFISMLTAALLVGAAGTASAIKYKGDLETNESVTFPEQGSAPANPSANKWKLYIKTDGLLYRLDEAGVESAVDTDTGDTLPVPDTTAVVEDNSDATKKVRIEAGSITTGTTRVLTMADEDIDLGANQTKLDGIESGATADQTAGEIKTLYESNANTNAFTDTEQSKLTGIASGAEVNPDIATQGEAEAGTDNVDMMTPLRTKQAIDYYARWGLKNAVIDGDFDLWPQGTSFNDPNGSYTSATWVGFFGSGNTVTFSRQGFTVGQTDVPDEPTYFIRINKTAGSAASPELHHRVEDVRTFAGETVTLSFWAKASAARDITGNLQQIFGTGGSPSSTVNHTIGTCSLTTSWTECTATVALTSISGKTLGSNDDHYLNIRLAWSANTNGSIDIAHVQLEKGSTATEFELRSLALERALLDRFFRVVSTAGVAVNGTTGGNAHIPHYGMRASPSVSVSAAVTIEDLAATTATQSPSNISIVSQDEHGGKYNLNNFTGLTNPAMYHMTTAGGHIFFDSRL